MSAFTNSFSFQLLLDGIKMSRREESSMSAVRRHLSASDTSLPVSSTSTSSSTYHSRFYSAPAPQHPVNSILQESELIRPTPSKEDSNKQKNGHHDSVRNGRKERE